jgi:hypothetical protein
MLPSAAQLVAVAVAVAVAVVLTAAAGIGLTVVALLAESVGNVIRLTAKAHTRR